MSRANVGSMNDEKNKWYHKNLKIIDNLDFSFINIDSISKIKIQS